MSAESDVRARLDQFVSDLTLLIQSATVEAFEAAFEAQRAAEGSTSRRPSGVRRRGAAASVAPKRAKRSGTDLEATATELAAHVAENAGQRMEEIAKALGTETSELRLPMKKLIEENRVRTTGQKRATKYHPHNGKASAAQLSLPLE